MALTALKIADLDPRWPEGRQYEFQGEWAARLFLKRVCRWNNSHLVDKDGLPLYPAYRDLCFRIFLDVESDHERYEAWVDYMADPAMLDRFCTGRRPLRAFWYKQPALLWAERHLWGSPGCPGRGAITWSLPKERVPPYEDCIGCMLCTEEEDCFRTPGQTHRPDCLLGRPGAVGANDWRLSVLVAALEQRGE